MPIRIYPEPSSESAVNTRCRVHVPADEGAHPILFLLHGVGDSEDDWEDVTHRKGDLRDWLPPGFPMYVVLPHCKPREGRDGAEMVYHDWHPDAGQFATMFEGGLVDGLEAAFPNIDWTRQAIGGISMGGFLAFEVASRRRAGRAPQHQPFRAIGLFSAALQACDDLASSCRALPVPKLLLSRWQTRDNEAIKGGNRTLVAEFGGRPWFDHDETQGDHRWPDWSPQIRLFISQLPAVLEA